jgi:hypothetical protein
MWGVGAECLWATWLSGEALVQHDRQQENVRVGCETGVALLHATTAPHLRGNNLKKWYSGYFTLAFRLVHTNIQTSSESVQTSSESVQPGHTSIQDVPH